MPTLLHALTRQNVEVNDAAVVPGSNTTVDGRVLADTWVPWTDFNYATLLVSFAGSSTRLMEALQTNGLFITT